MTDSPKGGAAALYVLFTLSGAAGLIYELLWARYLGLFVGHTAYAQILVLGIFLGGMSAGALFVGSRSERVRNPLLWYIGIELLVGFMGFVFHAVYSVATGAAYDVLFPALGSGLVLQVVKWTIAALLILPQSILLGTTFPLMNAAVLRRYPGRPGRTLSLLYFTNSLGAAAGVLIAGFWLLGFVGLQGTVLLAAAVNFLVAFGARFVLMVSPEPALPLPDAAARQTGASPPGTRPLEIPPRLQHILLGVAFGTAVASFIYEIGWIRMLSLVFGSATHSFELMLSAFILGLALGAFWCRSRADRWQDPVRALGVVQWVMGAAALATLPLYVASFEWMAWLMNTFTRTDGGYLGFTVARYGIALAIMLPSTFCAGVVLPLLTRILVVGGSGESAIGKVYGVNTLGSIVGVVVAGLILLPLIGLKAMLVLGGTLDMVLGAVLLFAVAEQRAAARPWAWGTAAATVVLAASGLLAGGFDTRLLSSTVFRDGEIPPPGSHEPIFHRDGRTATISVQRNLNSGLQIISTNGKPDASIPAYWFEPCTDGQQLQPLARDMATQTLAPLVPLAHAPSAATVAVIGHGSGLTSHFLLGNPAIDELVTVEIESNMVRGSRAFYPTNRRVFDDPRSSIVTDDAKSYFAASQRQFDLIFSEPSNPWVSGVSNLFTDEFYQSVRGYLAEGGIFGQWMQIYEINDGLVLTVLAAIHKNFPSYEVFFTNDTDIVIVASNELQLPVPDWTIVRSPDIAADLCHNFPLTPRMLDASRVLDRRALAPLLDGVLQPNSDFFPILDLGAERARFHATSAEGFFGLSRMRFDITAPFANRTALPAGELTAPVPDIWRMRALAVGEQVRRNTADNPSADVAVPATQYLKARWDGMLAGGEVPTDWKLWLEDLRVLEWSLHGGTAGWADEEFYETIQHFLDRTNPPAIVRDVVRFRYALAVWDFSTAVSVGDRLLRSVIDQEAFIAGDEYIDGMVVATLMAGDATAARRVFVAVAPLTGRLPTDVRMRLLNAYIESARVGTLRLP